MKVEPISNGNLRIWLSDEELDKRNAEHPDSAENTWLLLRRVMQAAQVRLGRLGKHIVAEILPVAGGCVLLLSARKTTLAGGPLVYHIEQLDVLYQLAEQWCALPDDVHTPPRTSLYETQSGYDLVIYPVPRLTRQQAHLLREFGLPVDCGEIAAAAVAEHGRLLAAGDALERLTGRAPRLQEPSDRER